MTAPTAALELFRRGCVIPAHPLALDENRHLDERRQRALSRYYIEAGAGGLAVGVHTTQFAIHDASVGLLAPVLELAATTAAEYSRPTVLVAGVVGPTRQAVAEAALAKHLGYHLVLLSPIKGAHERYLLERARAVGEVLPVIGFYLQPAVGGRALTRSFWAKLAEIDTVVGVKVAPFDRYRTVDVVRAIASAGRANQITLYTGNDDHILADLVTRHEVMVGGQPVTLQFSGGLLGQWAVWTKRAVQLLGDARAARDKPNGPGMHRMLVLDGQLTAANGAIFDADHGFRGCIPGIHEVLRRQGLLKGRWCLDPSETLSRGQLTAINQVCHAYPHLRDDDFVAANLDRWLRE